MTPPSDSPSLCQPFGLRSSEWEGAISVHDEQGQFTWNLFCFPCEKKKRISATRWWHLPPLIRPLFVELISNKRPFLNHGRSSGKDEITFGNEAEHSYDGGEKERMSFRQTHMAVRNTSSLGPALRSLEEVKKNRWFLKIYILTLY